MRDEALKKNLIQKYLAFQAKHIAKIPLHYCSVSEIVNYLVGQEHASRTHSRGIKNVRVIVPKQNFPVSALRSNNLIFTEHFLEGRNLAAITDKNIRKAIQTVVKQINKLNVPIEYTNQLPTRKEVTNPEFYNIWFCNMPGSAGPEGFSQLLSTPIFIEDLISINSSTTRKGLEFVKRTVLHEIMHGFGIPHIPPMQENAPHIAAIREFIVDPKRQADLVKLIKENRCAIGIDRQRDTIMFHQDIDGYHSKSGKFTLAPIDKEAIKHQWKKMIQENRFHESKGSFSSELIRPYNATDLLSPEDSRGLSSQLRQRKMPLPSKESRTSRDTATIVEQAWYAGLTDDAYKAFIIAFSVSLTNQLITYSNFSKLSKVRLQMIAEFVVATVIYNIPVAVFSMGSAEISKIILTHLSKDSSDKKWLSPYISVLFPIILSSIYQFYCEQRLYTIIKQISFMGLSMSINILFGLVGMCVGQITSSLGRAVLPGKVKLD